MVEYLTGLKEINDPLTEDGTTAFAMALARKDLELIRLFLHAKIPSDIDPIKMATRAILEIDKHETDNRYADLGKVLCEGLKKYNVTVEKAPSGPGVLSKEWVLKI